jgi:hydrogenase expression/formation protein HypE
MAILSQREGIELESTLESDTAPLAELAQLALRACPSHPARCATDHAAGVAARSTNWPGVGRGRPDRGESGSRCRRGPGRLRILGLDPLYVANEGKLVAVVPAGEARRLVEALRSHPAGPERAVVGRILRNGPGIVRSKSRIGGERIVSLLAGEPLPRIC